MSDGFDWRLFLLALVAATSLLPAREVWRFVRSLTGPRDLIEVPLAPLTDAERRRILLSIAALPALLVTFLLIAWSPHPVAMLPAIGGCTVGAAVSLLSGYRAVQGVRTGTAVINYRGWSGTYERKVQPYRFWLATAANSFATAWMALIALVMLVVTLEPASTPEPSCFVAGTMSIDHCSVIVHQREIRALSKRIAGNPEDGEALERRARLYEDGGDLGLARADWDRLRSIRNRQGRPLTGT